MAGLIPVNGKTIICMARASIHGLMAGGTKANTKWTKSMDLEFTNGPTVEFTKVSGLMESSMAKVNTYSKMAQ